MIVQAPSGSALSRLLHDHPRVTVEDGAPNEILWHEGSWGRRVCAGRRDLPLSGLVELMDNNPLVCADEFSVPSPAGTLALLALGPLVRAGLLASRPVCRFSFDTDEEDVASWLETAGWSGGAAVSNDPVDLGGALSLVAMAEVPAMNPWSDLDTLFEEAFGNSFFVQRDETSAWHVSLVAGQAHAAYRLRLTAGEDGGLLTVQAMADRDGKCGAAQMVHAFNVMAGFEESLGLG